MCLGLVLAVFLAGCGEDGATPSSSYRAVLFCGSDPVGDYIKIELNRDQKQVRRINYTKNEDSGWLAYSDVPATNTQASGFSFLKKAALPNGKWVLFGEYADTALIYQAFNADGTTDGQPAYCVISKQTAKTDFLTRPITG